MDGEVSIAAPTAGQAMRLAVAGLMPSDHSLSDALRRGLPPLAAADLFQVVLAGRSAVDALFPGVRKLGLDAQEIAILSALSELEANPAMPGALRVLQGEAFGAWPSLATLARLVARVLPGEGGLPNVTRLISLGLVARLGARAPAPEDRLGLTAIAGAALGLPLAEAAPKRLTVHAEAPAGWRGQGAAIAPELANCVVLRQGDAGDRRLYACLLAKSLGMDPMLVPKEREGFGAAAVLGRWLPVEEIATEPGRRTPLAHLEGYRGPRIVLAEHEGGVNADGPTIELPLPAFKAAERAAFWQVLLPGTDASVTHAAVRVGPARMAAVAARASAPGQTGGLTPRLRAALGAEYRADMEPQAGLLMQDVSRADYIADRATKTAIDLLLARCRYRAAHEDAAIPGVRVLFYGPSGTGKTMAAAWLATELGLPLFKLDLSTVISKYIGETEENLARLLDRAETGDMVLLMDEADSLFASRTETKDSSDRFANNQTNYLLSRIESFEGIAILTSNSPERFDSAFARRLDQVVAVPLPGPSERRRLWRAHLGETTLDGAEINRLAGRVDLAGGHIRNIVQTARVLADSDNRAVSMADVVRGVSVECDKLGRDAPGGLAR